MTVRKILLADDDAEDRSIILDAMELLNAADVMMFADNGEELLDLLHTNYSASLSPFLIVLDLNMPEMDGLTATRLIRKMLYPKCEIPIIALTADVMLEVKERCFQAGMNDYISKPIRMEEIQLILKKIFLQNGTRIKRRVNITALNLGKL